MDIENILDNTGKLSPSVQILPKLLHLLRDPNSSMLDIAGIIKLDATLATEIIHVSNSSYYAASQPCSAVDQAVNRIGFRDVHKIVGALSTSKVFDNDYPLHDIDSKSLWERSLRCGVVMHALSPRFGLEADTMYTVGLLHSIGIVALNQYYANCGIEGFDEEKFGGLLTPIDEKELLGFTNAEIGAALLKKWKFHAEIYDPIHFQLNPLDADSNVMEASLVYLTMQAIAQFETADPEELYTSFSPNIEVLEYTGLDVDTLMSVVIESESTVEWLVNSV